MAIDFNLLKRTSETPGAPGFEKSIRELVIAEIKDHVDSLHTDRMGNLVAFKKGKTNKKIMSTAHLDEIGFIVTHVDDKGFIRFHTLGGFDPKTLTAQRVIVHGKKDLIGVMGGKPIHVMTPEERKQSLMCQDYFVDVGLPADEVKKLVDVGTPITRQRDMIEMGSCVNGKSLDNRVAVYILIETLKKLKNPAFDFYGVFTVQEEVGLRGATVASHQIEPDIGINIDVTIAFDTPGAKEEEMIARLGKGTAIKILDGSVICDTRLVEFMKKQAEANKIPYQLEILTAGGTDSAAMQRMSKNGCIVGAISIPCRNVHQTVEMCNKDDISYSIDLLIKCVENMDQFSEEF
ncbi:M42 family metallopeptidase [bacterium]|nr:M42 family metallopeptidase [bacterium]